MERDGWDDVMDELDADEDQLRLDELIDAESASDRTPRLEG